MEIYIEENYEALSERAAGIVANFLKENPSAVLGLATGSTPQKTYELLSEKYGKGEISFKEAKTFNLDEYSGLSPGNPQSYHFFMEENLFSKIDIDIKNTFFPTDFGPDYENYDKKIEESGGIDLQILGIGRNGHIGFNEPGSSFSSKTRQVLLSEATIKDNSRFFKDIREVPEKAVTMGISTIMKAKKIILLAGGKNKKEIIRKMISGVISPEIPASVLQKHKNFIIILDKQSAGKNKED
jgi:glucosamine-6-phosphate deaminase